MDIIRTLLLLIVAVSSAAARESAANPELSGVSKTEGSPNAHLRGPLSVEGILVETDSSGAGGEEGRFEIGNPFGLPCNINGKQCASNSSNGNCCSGRCYNGKCRQQCSKARLDIMRKQLGMLQWVEMCMPFLRYWELQ